MYCSVVVDGLPKYFMGVTIPRVDQILQQEHVRLLWIFGYKSWRADLTGFFLLFLVIPYVFPYASG